MRKFVWILCALITFTAVSNAQESERIKGDRNLTINQTYVDGFKKVVIGEDFKVELFYNKKPSVEIETDDNLHEYINIEVVDSILNIKTTGDIRPKKLDVKINYGDGFSDIEVRQNGEVRSLTSLELKDASLKTSGSARAYLNIKADNFNFSSSDKTKIKLNVTANNVEAVIGDNTKLDALVNATDVKMDLYQRANVDIEGVTDSLRIRTDNNAQFNGKNFTAKSCRVVAEMASDVYVEVMEAIDIETSGSSEIYLYGEPKITISRFLDTAKLQKKEK